jgi:hypothetical protein
MTDPKKLIRCDRRYLGICLGVQLGFLLVIAVAGLIWFHTISIAVACAVFGLFTVIRWLIRRTWKFTVGPDHIRTEKLFTSHIDLRTPLDQMVGISAYEATKACTTGSDFFAARNAQAVRRRSGSRIPPVRLAVQGRCGRFSNSAMIE